LGRPEKPEDYNFKIGQYDQDESYAAFKESAYNNGPYHALCVPFSLFDSDIAILLLVYNLFNLQSDRSSALIIISNVRVSQISTHRHKLVKMAFIDGNIPSTILKSDKQVEQETEARAKQEQEATLLYRAFLSINVNRLDIFYSF
jgi:hypothetical protein